ncbi:hypothetical protein BKA70DRAFT_178236 [Coprinopsis sp. MPI-PUGE-AT-0042]|nr:hypothetical protein BKA70DRAFT_178236 [Coprinopsis sp. MPI-PUGE-AT-0042]
MSGLFLQVFPLPLSISAGSWSWGQQALVSNYIEPRTPHVHRYGPDQYIQHPCLYSFPSLNAYFAVAAAHNIMESSHPLQLAADERIGEDSKVLIQRHG